MKFLLLGLLSLPAWSQSVVLVTTYEPDFKESLVNATIMRNIEPKTKYSCRSKSIAPISFYLKTSDQGDCSATLVMSSLTEPTLSQKIDICEKTNFTKTFINRVWGETYKYKVLNENSFDLYYLGEGLDVTDELVARTKNFESKLWECEMSETE